MHPALTRPSARRTALGTVALFVAYYSLAAVGLRWGTVHAMASPVFPAAGVALAGLLLGGPRLWPAVFAGTVAALYTTGRPWAAGGAAGLG
ncbi:MAG TPA: hypothetical protein VF796_10225, partial [Humisphaera sp.]